jgi:phosphatidylglycerophosphatase A
LFALPLAVLIGELWGWQAQIGAAAVVTVASIWATRPFVTDEGDAGWICVDEAAGAFICVIGLPVWPFALIAWLVFRAADIFKNLAPGVAEAERLEGAIGVTADDVVAGLYGLVVGHTLWAVL